MFIVGIDDRLSFGFQVIFFIIQLVNVRAATPQQGKNVQYFALKILGSIIRSPTRKKVKPKFIQKIGRGTISLPKKFILINMDFS